MIDLDALSHAAVAASNLAIPFVKQLTAAVTARDAEAGRYVHWGATSQDIIDTALMRPGRLDQLIYIPLPD